MNRRSQAQKSRSRLVRIAQLKVASDMAYAMGKRGLARKLGKMMERPK